MTEQEIRDTITTTAILNDLLESRLMALSKQEINHKNLEKAVIRSFKASKGLSYTIDKKLGSCKSETFKNVCDEIDDVLSIILKKLTN